MMLRKQANSRKSHIKKSNQHYYRFCIMHIMFQRKGGDTLHLLLLCLCVAHLGGVVSPLSTIAIGTRVEIGEGPTAH